MAHELANTNGKTAMAYFGEVPWHRLGTKLENPATAEEAITAAGLDYEVELTRLVTVNDILVPNRRAVVRQDSKEVLGVVGTCYQPVQNRECFGFMAAIRQPDDAARQDGSIVGFERKVNKSTRILCCLRPTFDLSMRFWGGRCHSGDRVENAQKANSRTNSFLYIVYQT